MRKTCSFLLIVLAYSCSPVSKSILRKTFAESEQTFNDHVGFALYDLESKKMVFEYQADRYFTPASNTKIFTLFASLKILGDSIPALYYVDSGDSLFFWGSGDPGFLYKNVFNNGRTIEFLKGRNEHLSFSTSNFYTTPFGSGWAWDDYNSSYSPERNAFPLYGNIVSFQSDRQTYVIEPAFFKSYLKKGSAKDEAELIRNPASNEFTFYPSLKKTRFKEDVPFKTDSVLTALLIEDTIQHEVRVANRKITSNKKTFYSIPSDSLYKVMMQQSDNFIAEQLLLICSGVLTDSLKTEITIDYVKKNFLQDLTDEPIWVDGSGLSRYNLFTPRSVVQLWDKIYKEVPRERLFQLLAVGGMPGTLKNYYKADKPYLFGKTGSLSNNHCLSGFLVTRKGKTLIFSFMNSNFAKPGSEIRNNMQRIIKSIYENY
jgi:D-alanyl-D-alanine carboxypeptidase/D-alanyl-D-alanine-endopeptidase (penicillin-binding protein 4)